MNVEATRRIKFKLLKNLNSIEWPHTFTTNLFCLFGHYIVETLLIKNGNI